MSRWVWKGLIRHEMPRPVGSDTSIIPVVEGMFKEGLAHHAMAPGIDAAPLATTSAWAVFGAARRWFQTPARIPAEEMATNIETMVKPLRLSGSG